MPFAVQVVMPFAVTHIRGLAALSLTQHRPLLHLPGALQNVKHLLKMSARARASADLGLTATPLAVHGIPPAVQGARFIMQSAPCAPDSWAKPRNAATAPLASSMVRKNERRPG